MSGGTGSVRETPIHFPRTMSDPHMAASTQPTHPRAQPLNICEWSHMTRRFPKTCSVHVFWKSCNWPTSHTTVIKNGHKVNRFACTECLHNSEKTKVINFLFSPIKSYTFLLHNHVFFTSKFYVEGWLFNRFMRLLQISSMIDIAPSQKKVTHLSMPLSINVNCRIKLRFVDFLGKFLLDFMRL